MEDLGPIMTRGKISMENQVQERTRAEACPLQKTGQAMEAREMLGRSQSQAARFQAWFRDGRSLLLRPQEIERRSGVSQPIFYRGTMILAVSGQQEKGRSCQGMNKPVRIDGDGDFIFSREQIIEHARKVKIQKRWNRITYIPYLFITPLILVFFIGFIVVEMFKCLFLGDV